MALVPNNVINGKVLHDYQRKGLKISQCDITIQAADYSSGFDVTSIKQSFGVKAIVDIVNVSLRASGGTLKPFAWAFDHNTGKIRMYEAMTTGSPGTQDEIESADLANNDILRVTLIGY